MATILRAKKGSYFRYRFMLYHANAAGKADTTRPYVLPEGTTAKFMIDTPAPITIGATTTTAYVEVYAPATMTSQWSIGNLQFNLEITPPAGPEEKFSLVSGILKLEK